MTNQCSKSEARMVAGCRVRSVLPGAGAVVHILPLLFTFVRGFDNKNIFRTPTFVGRGSGRQKHETRLNSLKLAKTLILKFFLFSTKANGGAPSELRMFWDRLPGPALAGLASAQAVIWRPFWPRNDKGNPNGQVLGWHGGPGFGRVRLHRACCCAQDRRQVLCGAGERCPRKGTWLWFVALCRSPSVDAMLCGRAGTGRQDASPPRQAGTPAATGVLHHVAEHDSAPFSSQSCDSPFKRVLLAWVTFYG